MINWHECYKKALNPELHWGVTELLDIINEVNVIGDLGISKQNTAEIQFNSVSVRAILRATQPMASVLGATLHTLIAPAYFENSDYLSLLAVYSGDVGVGAPEESRFDAFQRIMAANGLTEDATNRSQMSASTGLDNDLFVAPAVILSLSRRPDLFVHELVGIDIHLRQSGLLRPWDWCRVNGLDGPWNRLDLNSELPDLSTPLQRVTSVVENGQLDAVRVRSGIEISQALLAHWEYAVWNSVYHTANPRLAMERLMKRRAREAAVYHSRSRLEGKTIQSWFKNAVQDPTGFVDALAKSQYVRAGVPEKSRLLTILADFGGPMFRIFSAEDREIISRWIVSLESSAPKPNTELIDKNVPRAYFKAQSPVHSEPREFRRPTSIRQAYTSLQERVLNPAEHEFCVDYIDYWLSLAESSLDRHPFPLPKQLPERGGLISWLLDAHDEHAKAVDLDVSAKHPPTRQAVIESTVQLAPLTLIDGSWLLGFSDIGVVSGRIGFSLFETFWDELGNGDIELNHPRLYRQVLKGMDVDLPPTSSQKFAESTLIDDKSFELPVYWLAIGHFPESRLPEILGLNLAMELSGVGGGYMVARQGLQAHGFPTVFVDIHNTIDNVSTGHAAWAAKAIDAFFDSVQRTGASASYVNALWSRVRVGFASLDPKRDKRGFPFDRRSRKIPLSTMLGRRLSQSHVIPQK